MQVTERDAGSELYAYVRGRYHERKRNAHVCARSRASEKDVDKKEIEQNTHSATILPMQVWEIKERDSAHTRACARALACEEEKRWGEIVDKPLILPMRLRSVIQRMSSVVDTLFQRSILV